MEGIIALGGRHMLETGEWWVPRLYGELYAFKPPLAYWMAAGIEALFGRQSEFALRSPTAACGLGLGLALLVGMGRMVNPRCGLAAGLAGITSALFIEQVDTAGFDLPLAFGLVVAVLAACRNLTGEAADGRMWLVAYAGLAFAFLAKGLPALVMFAPGLLVAAILLKRVPRLLDGRHVAGMALFVLLAGGYAALAYRAEGRAAFQQHLGEIMLRSGKWTWGQLLQTVVKPAVIFAVLLPWSIVVTGWVLAAMSRLFGGAPRWSSALSGGARKLLPLPLTERTRGPAIVAWCFLLLGLLAFVAVPTDDTRYYVSLGGPLAMLAGISLERLPDRWPARTTAALTAIGLVVWVVQVGIVQPRRAAKRSLRSVAVAFAPHVPPEATVYVETQDSYSSLFYYLDRPVRAWLPGQGGPQAGDYALLVDQRGAGLETAGELEFKPITEVSGRDKHRYTLGKLGPASP